MTFFHQDTYFDRVVKFWTWQRYSYNVHGVNDFAFMAERPYQIFRLKKNKEYF